MNGGIRACCNETCGVVGVWECHVQSERGAVGEPVQIESTPMGDDGPAPSRRHRHEVVSRRIGKRVHAPGFAADSAVGNEAGDEPRAEASGSELALFGDAAL